MKLMLLFILLTLSVSVFAQSKVAMVKLLRGDVEAFTPGKKVKLKVDDWVTNGSIIKTADKSFVKLIFVDKSHMNVGPNAEMKIESFSGKDSGVIDLVKGKIRSEVTKDYLQIQNKDKSKLFIKTPNAVMGVRGTDFLISTNGKSTTTSLFEGEIVFNRLEKRGVYSSSRLEEIVSSGVKLFPREFSVVDGHRAPPTIPAYMNIQQYETLLRNKNFDAIRTPSNESTDLSKKSVVPTGLNGHQVSNTSETLKSEVAQVAALEPIQARPSSSDPDGYVKGDMIKPANGSFVHVETGVIIPPGPGSVLDANSNTYVPGAESGTVAQDGSYVPPQNIVITEDGKVLSLSVDKNGNQIATEVPKPVPTVTSSSTLVVGGPSPASLPRDIPTKLPSGDILLPQAGLDTRIQQTGGLGGANDASRVLSGATSPIGPATIIVNPPTGSGP